MISSDTGDTIQFESIRLNWSLGYDMFLRKTPKEKITLENSTMGSTDIVLKHLTQTSTDIRPTHDHKEDMYHSQTVF